MPTQSRPFANFAIAALLLALTCAATGQPVATARISGTVTASESKPVANAVVTLESAFGATIAKTKTDANGRYEFPDLKPAVYGIVAKTASACAISSAINATEGSSIIVPLKMTDRSLCSNATQFTH